MPEGLIGVNCPEEEGRADGRSWAEGQPREKLAELLGHQDDLRNAAARGPMSVYFIIAPEHTNDADRAVHFWRALPDSQAVFSGVPGMSQRYLHQFVEAVIEACKRRRSRNK
jgi:hypothetical protein